MIWRRLFDWSSMISELTPGPGICKCWTLYVGCRSYVDKHSHVNGHFCRFLWVNGPIQRRCTIFFDDLCSYFNAPGEGKTQRPYTWCTLDIAPLRESSPQKCSGMARVVKGFHSFTCTPTRLSAIGMSHTCFPLPSYSWYSFTNPEGWKAELAWVAGYIVRQFTCPNAVTHPTTNRAQCSTTALIETNALQLH